MTDKVAFQRTGICESMSSYGLLNKPPSANPLIASDSDRNYAGTEYCDMVCEKLMVVKNSSSRNNLVRFPKGLT